MKIIKLSGIVLGFSLFLGACSTDDQPQIAETVPYANDALVEDAMVDEYWAKDNFDLQRFGPLLERADNPQEFEALLNSDDGLNNLDLNGDGYVDYISVDEFDDRGPNERGLSLFTRFGPDLVQEIAQVFFYRDEPNYPGSRILLRGNEQLYGDNQYYETNWLDRSIGLVTTLFSDRDDYYHSPYYYDNYPSDYVTYEVVETPVYRTRIEQLYPQPVFVYTPAPAYVSKIKIKSPNNGKWMNNIHAKLAKPTKEQADYIKSIPPRSARARADKPGKPENKGNKPDDKGGDRPGRSEDAPGRVNQPNDDRKGNPGQGNPGKPDKAEKQNDNPQKQGNEGKGQGKGEGKGQGKGQKP